MSDDITQTLRAVVPKMPESGTPIAWPVKVRSELLLEAAAQIERLRASLEQFRCSCDPGECVEYGERWSSVCEKGEARDVLEGKP